MQAKKDNSHGEGIICNLTIVSWTIKQRNSKVATLGNKEKEMLWKLSLRDSTSYGFPDEQ